MRLDLRSASLPTVSSCSKCTDNSMKKDKVIINFMSKALVCTKNVSHVPAEWVDGTVGATQPHCRISANGC